MAEKTAKARVLVATQIEGKIYQPNDIVEGDEKVLAGLHKAGQVDTTKEAVAYAESLKPKAEPAK